ncbi:YncE family protein [Foetidibacter luteolus]|uniref:YncE family protein n=1 Tax=Foetidibacter luteolus TaxID=2608880 RepID=UPI00129A8019|nr:YncE family protein [Foetidibacter luteolus]
MRKHVWKWLLPVVLLINACSKDDDGPTPPAVKPTSGLFILGEGAFGSNGAMVTYYDLSTSTASGDIFKQENGIALGDVANDAITYGAKMYIAVNNSNKLVIANAQTTKLIISISITLPRNIISYKGNVLVTSWDNKVSVIDTATLTVTKTINTGLNPEGLAIQGNYLYVANSGGLNFPDYDKTVSVIDVNTWAETKKITIGPNPQKVGINSLGQVLVSSFGDYTPANPPKIYILDGSNNTLKDSITTPVSDMTVFNDTIYAYYTEYDENFQIKGIHYPVIDSKTKAIVRNNFITDGTVITYPYGISVDESNGDVYITDAKNFINTGEVFCFDRNGKLKFKFSVSPAVGPKKVLFLR